MMDVAHGFTRTLVGTTFESARARIEAALKEEGFGILTEIDVQGTLRARLDVAFRKYSILGVCNPTLAHAALRADLAVGLLMPCTIVVTEDDAGNAVLAFLDPDALWRMAGSPPGLAETMHEAHARLERALARA